VIKARRMRWVGYVAQMGEMQNAYNILIGKPEWKSPLGRPRCRWDDNIEIELREIRWGGGWTGCIWLRMGTNGRPL
jgi:hypothetical protein